jgi:2-polyprenyl-3-methyl-5-hydroxy-6-metoxy-1,4-benzoquinol methylase
MIYISVYHVDGQRKEDPMTDQQRLTEALDRFDMVQAADILEHVSQAKDGLIAGSELLTKLERTLGTTFETLFA